MRYVPVSPIAGDILLVLCVSCTVFFVEIVPCSSKEAVVRCMRNYLVSRHIWRVKESTPRFRSSAQNWRYRTAFRRSGCVEWISRENIYAWTICAPRWNGARPRLLVLRFFFFIRIAWLRVPVCACRDPGTTLLHECSIDGIAEWSLLMRFGAKKDSPSPSPHFFFLLSESILMSIQRKATVFSRKLMVCRYVVENPLLTGYLKSQNRERMWWQGQCEGIARESTYVEYTVSIYTVSI